jgi:Polyketide cyclase / dehydrase and lipid transport
MKLELQVEINGPADAAWAVLGERFADIGEWAAPIRSSTLDGELGIGAIRTCQIAKFGPLALGAVRERLIAFDPARMTLAYESVDGLPSFITSAVNRLSIHNVSDRRCLVHSQGNVALQRRVWLFEPLVKWRLQVAARLVLEELRHQVEHGRAHPRKVASTDAAALVSRSA